eukprot:8909139-Pyramimonas_sp.AAC.1
MHRRCIADVSAMRREPPTPSAPSHAREARAEATGRSTSQDSQCPAGGERRAGSALGPTAAVFPGRAGVLA